MIKALLAKKYSLFLVPLSGVLMGLCLVFPKVGFLQWVAMVPLLLWLFSRDLGARRAPLKLWGVGALYFLSFYLVVYHWFFYLYPMEFAGVTKGEAAALVVICWLGLSLLQTLFSSLIFPLFALLTRTRVARRSLLLLPFLFAVQYTVAEWAQTLTWLGMPWARLALGQLEGGFLINSASLFGPYLLTFALVLFNGLLAVALWRADKIRFCTVALASVFVATFVLGALGTILNDENKGEAVVVAAVQGNIGSAQKWSSDNTQKTYEVYERYTALAAAEGAEIVVFPETFLPYTITEDSRVGRFVRRLAVQYDVTILCGAFDAREGEEYNAIFTVLPDGSFHEVKYAKRHLVPFGEYVPMRDLMEAVLPLLADIGMLSDDLTPGEDSAIITLPEGNVGGLICFDSIYEELARDSVRDGAELFVLPTNDSWFTNSAAVYMHEGQARLRAIETGRWIVRAADTGISAVIDPDGNVHGEQPAMVEGMAIATARVTSARTLYSYIGNLFVYLQIAALLALPVSEVVLVIRDKKKRMA